MVFGFDLVWAAIDRSCAGVRLPYIHTYMYAYIQMYADSWTESGTKLAGCGCRACVCGAGTGRCRDLIPYQQSRVCLIIYLNLVFFAVQSCKNFIKSCLLGARGGSSGF